MYSFLNYRRNKENQMYSFLNYQWFYKAITNISPKFEKDGTKKKLLSLMG